MSSTLTIEAAGAPVILIADDDPIMRALMQKKLQKFASKVVVAVDGAEAWACASQSAVCMAIVDLDMPNIDGITLIRCLRTHPQTQHIPIVVCTSCANPADMQQALDAGASSYLTKPINWSLFEPHMAMLLNGSRKIEALNTEVARLERRVGELLAVISEHGETAINLPKTIPAPTATVVSSRSKPDLRNDFSDLDEGIARLRQRVTVD